MKLVGGKRDGEEVSFKGPNGREQALPPGCVLNYHFGPPKDGQITKQMQLEFPDPNREIYASIPGVFETYVLRDDGDFYLVPPVLVKPN